MRLIALIFFQFFLVFGWASDQQSLDTAYASFLDPLVKDGYMPAYHLTVFKDGDVRVKRGLGTRGAISHPEPTEDTPFALLELSKPLVSVAVLKLVDQGLIDLEASLSEYLPEFSNVALSDRTPMGRHLKVRDLFTHTAGFSYNEDFMSVGGFPGSYQRENLFTLDSMTSLDPGALDLAGQVRKLSTMPLANVPGTVFEYSVSVDVLGRLAEVVSGKTLDVFLKQTLFESLGMEDTGFLIAAENIDRRAVLMKPLIRTFPVPGTYQRFEPHPLFGKKNGEIGGVIGFLSGGAGLVSTGRDMMVFARFLLDDMQLSNGRFFLSKELRSRVYTHQLPRSLGDKPLADSLPLSTGDGFSLALNIRPERGSSIRAEGPMQMDFLYWSGFTSSVFWIDFSNNVAGVFLSQIRPSQRYLVGELDEIADNFY